MILFLLTALIARADLCDEHFRPNPVQRVLGVKLSPERYKEFQKSVDGRYPAIGLRQLALKRREVDVHEYLAWLVRLDPALETYVENLVAQKQRLRLPMGLSFSFRKVRETIDARQQAAMAKRMVKLARISFSDGQPGSLWSHALDVFIPKRYAEKLVEEEILTAQAKEEMTEKFETFGITHRIKPGKLAKIEFLDHWNATKGRKYLRYAATRVLMALSLFSTISSVQYYFAAQAQADELERRTEESESRQTRMRHINEGMEESLNRLRSVH